MQVEGSLFALLVVLHLLAKVNSTLSALSQCFPNRIAKNSEKTIRSVDVLARGMSPHSSVHLTALTLACPAFQSCLNADDLEQKKAADREEKTGDLTSDQRDEEISDEHPNDAPHYCRADLGARAAVYSMQGDRPYMEDAFMAVVDLSQANDGRPAALFGVFDGHGGDQVSRFASEHLAGLILGQKNPFDWRMSPEQCLQWAFQQLDEEWVAACHRCPKTWDENEQDVEKEKERVQKQKEEKLQQGTTCLVALVFAGTDGRARVYTASVGDSRAVLSRKERAIELSVDHKPCRDDEKARIEALGGEVVHRKGTWRVQGRLAMTRAIGDTYLKPYVTSEADVQHIILSSVKPRYTGSEKRRRAGKIGDDWLILASDGVWDVLSSQTAVDLVRRCATADEAAAQLATAAKCRGSHDNITALVVDLRNLDASFDRPSLLAPSKPFFLP